MRARPFAAILTACLVITPIGIARAQSEWRVWLGDHPLSPIDDPRPGVHLGPEVTLGSTTWQARWEAGPGSTSWPELVHVAGPLPPPTAPPRMELVIVTTEALAQDSTQLTPFMAFRAAEGWEVVLATEAHWDHATGADSDERSDRIRAWLVDEYLEDPGAYVLLVGDPDPDGGDVPMKDTHPLLEVVHYYEDWLADLMDPVATDYYYADLDGDWDCDDDGRFGEYPDDAGEGCVDFGPELYVGRLPIYDGDASALDTLLARALERDLEPDKSYRRHVLLPGALFGVAGSPAPNGGEYPEDDDGACILATVYRDLPDTMQDHATRLFEDEGLCTSPYEHEGSLTRDEVLERWADGRGLVVWAGHGSAEGVYRTTWLDDTNGDGDADSSECWSPAFLESPDAADLVDVPGAFTWHISCSNGTPAEADNIGTELLYGGATATATASTPAFGVTVGFGETWEPRPDLATSATAGYYYALNVASGMTAGEALAWTKYALPGDGWVDYYEHVDFTGAAWTTRMQYNLYGDPTRSLELCEADADCDDGSACSGSETCSDGFCVHQDPIDCGHLDADCTVGSCDADSGECVSVPRHDGTTCDDGLWCTEGDSCEAGQCGGADRDCGERDGYLSWCDEEADACGWEELESEPVVTDDDGCQCAAAASRPRAAALLLALTLAIVTRRVRAHEEERS